MQDDDDEIIQINTSSNKSSTNIFTSLWKETEKMSNKSSIFSPFIVEKPKISFLKSGIIEKD